MARKSEYWLLKPEMSKTNFKNQKKLKQKNQYLNPNGNRKKC